MQKSVLDCNSITNCQFTATEHNNFVRIQAFWGGNKKTGKAKRKIWTQHQKVVLKQFCDKLYCKTIFSKMALNYSANDKNNATHSIRWYNFLCLSVQSFWQFNGTTQNFHCLNSHKTSDKNLMSLSTGNRSYRRQQTTTKPTAYQTSAN